MEGMENQWLGTKGSDGATAGAGEAASRMGRELYGRELRWFLTVKLVEVGEPMRVRDLVTALGEAGFTVAGRASKVISDCLRWESSRRRVIRLGRGIYQASTRIPRTTLRRLRMRVSEFGERLPGPVRTQPLRPPRPLVSPGGPKDLRRRRFTTADKLRRIREQRQPHATNPLQVQSQSAPAGAPHRPLSQRALFSSGP